MNDFNPAYAGIYDQLYAEKPYAAEVATALELLGLSVSSLLDVGCGTGRHAREFAARGIFVTGMDRDAGMIAAATAAPPGAGPAPRFHVGGPALAPPGPFDAATALFNVVNYLPDTRALLEFFTEIGRRLRARAPFVFDAWNGLAVITDPPRTKRVEFECDGRRIVSIATPEMDLWAQRTTMHCEIIVAEPGRLDEIIRQSFDHRLWTPREFCDLLDLAGFAVPFVGTWEAPGRPAEAGDWKLLFRTERLP
jgi:SAM-dependent methyltransferase